MTKPSSLLRRIPLPPFPRRTVLMGAAVLSLAGLLVAVIGLATDGRTITGAPAWLKPAKFGVSIAIYCATLGWFLSMVRGHRRAVQVIAWLTALSLVGELALIALQVVRGTTSHFNTATAFDSTVFSVMGAMISVVFLAAVAAAILLARERSLAPALASGIRGGLVASLAGMAEAGLMLANSARTVGAPDGGPGLPIMGWSIQHGDLRVAHFVGLHGLQALPLLAWALTRYAPALGQVTQVRLVRLATAALIGVVVVFAWQAERGLPLLRPDLPIGLALTAIVLFVAGGALIVTRAGRIPA